MNKVRAFSACAGTVAIAIFAGCSGGSGGSADGSLTLALADAPVDNVSQIFVKLNGVRLKPQSGAAIEFPFASPLTVDLLTLDDTNSEMLLDHVKVPAGMYNWMELEVSAELDGTLDSYVVAPTGQYEIRVPSGSQSGLRLVSPFVITANQETSFLIDWNARMALTTPPGQTDPNGNQAYILKPAFRIIDLTQYGTLSGTVAVPLVMDSSCTNDLNADTGNVVYIYDKFDSGTQSPDDIGGAGGPQPVATADVKLASDGTYAYSTILSPGDYTVAFTCQASKDDPDADDDVVFVSPQDVTITDGGTANVEFQ